jgi:hypothetical protein
MFFRKAASSTDPGLRSLLQKAVRRGWVPHVARSASLLWERGDRNWLRSRTATLVFEECWPLAEMLLEREPGLGGKIRLLSAVARSVKHKDAAALGTLAYEWSRGEKQRAAISPLVGKFERTAIRTVAAALERPVEFWAWARRQRPGSSFLDAAEKAQRSGGWPWDISMTFAAGYLFATDGTPPIDAGDPGVVEFECWAAVDKHTPIGKAALRNVAHRSGCSYAQLAWASFYFESAVVNAMHPSRWWDLERLYRLFSVGLHPEQAALLWRSVRDEVALAVRAEAFRLQAELTSSGRMFDNKVKLFET